MSHRMPLRSFRRPTCKTHQPSAQRSHADNPKAVTAPGIAP
jgi:hypothetical protein